MQNLNSRVKQIGDMISHAYYTAAAKESLALIEYSMRELLRREVTRLASSDRLKVNKAELEIGKGMKGIDEFTMGQLLGVIRVSKFFDAWPKATGRSLGSVEMINLDAVVKLRNKLVHDSAEAERSDAELLLYVLRVFLETFGIMMLEDGDTRSASRTKKETVTEPSRNSLDEVKQTGSPTDEKKNRDELLPGSDRTPPAQVPEEATSAPPAMVTAVNTISEDGISRKPIEWDTREALAEIRRSIRPTLKELNGKVSISKDDEDETIFLRVRFRHPVWSKKHFIGVRIGPPLLGHRAWLETSLESVAWLPKPVEREVQAALRAKPDWQELLRESNSTRHTVPCMPLPAADRGDLVQHATEVLLDWISFLPGLFEHSWDSLSEWERVISHGDEELVKYRTLLKHDCDEAREDPWFLWLMGRYKESKFQTDDAEELLTLLIRKAPDFPWAYAFLGDVNVQRNDWEKAIHFYAEAYRRFPQERPMEFLDAYQDVASVAKDFGRAADVLEEIIERDPEWPEAQSRYGLFLLKSGKEREAESVLRRCVEEDRERKQSCSNLAKILENRGEYQDAIEVLQKSQKKDGTLYASASNGIKRIEKKMSAKKGAKVARAKG